MTKKIIPLIALLLFFLACKKEEKLKPLSLLDYGIPLTIMAPDSAKVKHNKYALEEDITIAGPPNYKLQIFISGVTDSDPKKVIESQKKLVQEQPYFHKITLENEDGFIFESRIDSTHTFGFRKVKIMGDKEIVFREALLGTFSKEDIEKMYQAVEGVKSK